MITNHYTIRPNEIKAGMVFVNIVTCHITHVDENGKVYFSLYRCPYPDPELYGNIPQGNKIDNVSIIDSLFPVIGWANET